MLHKETIQHLSDKDLVKEICIGKSTIVFGQLYDRYRHQVYNKCCDFVKQTDQASELTKAIFLKVFKNLDNYNPSCSFAHWIYALTYDHCATFIYKQQALDHTRFKEESDPLLLKIEVGENSLFKMNALKLQKAFDLIDPVDRSILLLKYQDDASIKELSILLVIHQVQVKERLKIAKARITQVYHNL